MFLWLLSWIGLAGQVAFAIFSFGKLHNLLQVTLSCAHTSLIRMHFVHCELRVFTFWPRQLEVAIDVAQNVRVKSKGNASNWLDGWVSTQR